jgi:ssDNA-binding Zn-finger/Zn-ribbon topoisomerase 1
MRLTCPICGKGKLVRTSAGWTCDHLISIDDICNFRIFENYFGYDITESIIFQIIKTGESDEIEFIKDGRTFVGRLVIREGQLTVKFSNHDNVETLVQCPMCGGQIGIYQKAYICEHFFGSDNAKCSVYIPKVYLGVEIDRNMALQLLSERKTTFIAGFVSKNNYKFAGRLFLDENGSLKIDTTITPCPKCGGNIYQGSKAYNCSNWKTEHVKCNFTVWNVIWGKTITPDMVEQLCTNRETSEMEFISKDGKRFQGKFVLNEDFYVKVI